MPACAPPTPAAAALRNEGGSGSGTGVSVIWTCEGTTEHQLGRQCTPQQPAMATKGLHGFGGVNRRPSS